MYDLHSLVRSGYLARSGKCTTRIVNSEKKWKKRNELTIN